MGKFFDIDGGFFRGMTRVADFIILDILILILCIPVITIGPAITAGYYVALKEVRDEEGYLIRGFWKAFKQNFKQGFLIELIGVLVGYLLYIDLSVMYKYITIEQGLLNRLLFFVLLGFVLVVFATMIYVFPMLAKFENTILKILKNSIVMAMKHLPQTIIMVIITGGLVYASVTYPLLVVFTIGLSLYVNSFIMVRIFDLYIKKDTNEDEPNESHEKERNKGYHIDMY